MFIKAVRLSDQERICSFRFSYGTGMTCHAFVIYKMTNTDGRYRIRVKPAEIPEEQTEWRTVEEIFPLKIMRVLKTYQVGRWKGFHKVNRRVMDGNGFSLEACFFSGKKIHAHGYMCCPNHYSEVKAALDECFMKMVQDSFFLDNISI